MLQFLFGAFIRVKCHIRSHCLIVAMLHSAGPLAQEPQVSVWPLTFVSLSADSRSAVFSHLFKYMHLVLINRLGGLSLSRNCVVLW